MWPNQKNLWKFGKTKCKYKKDEHVFDRDISTEQKYYLKKAFFYKIFCCVFWPAFWCLFNWNWIEMIVLHFQDFILPFKLERQKIRTVENNNVVFHATKLKLGLKYIFSTFTLKIRKLLQLRLKKSVSTIFWCASIWKMVQIHNYVSWK